MLIQFLHRVSRHVSRHVSRRMSRHLSLHTARHLPWLRRPAAPTPWRAPPAADGEERPLGCGWFDSSHELQCGLLVQEADAQALSALPLGDWLDLQLRTWHGSPSVGNVL